MATNPETIEERNQPFTKRVVETITNTTGTKRGRARISLPLAAGFAALAPEPFNAISAALLAFVALEIN